MDDQTIEKFAELFANCAVTGNTAELRKEAAAQKLVKEAIDPLLVLGPLAGLGIGAAGGYYGTSDEKRKKRNAIYGALTGGLTGLAVPAMFAAKNLMAPQTPESSGASGGGEKPSASQNAAAKNPWWQLSDAVVARPDSPFAKNLPKDHPYYNWGLFNPHNYTFNAAGTGLGAGTGLYLDRNAAQRAANLDGMRAAFKAFLAGKETPTADKTVVVKGKPKETSTQTYDTRPIDAGVDAVNDSARRSMAASTLKDRLAELIPFRAPQIGHRGEAAKLLGVSQWKPNLKSLFNPPPPSLPPGVHGPLPKQPNFSSRLADFLGSFSEYRKRLGDVNAVAEHLRTKTLPAEAGESGRPARTTRALAAALAASANRAPAPPAGMHRGTPPSAVEVENAIRDLAPGQAKDVKKPILGGRRAAAGGLLGFLMANQHIARRLLNNVVGEGAAEQPPAK